MGIKLIKLCKALKVDLITVVDFCEKIGKPILTDPNYRIDEDTHILILKEFSKPKNSSSSDTLIKESHKQNSNDDELFSPLELSKQYHKDVEVIEEISVEDGFDLLEIELECTFEEYSYKELLSRDEWRTFRKKILKRDNFQCTKCGSRDFLHVHHLYYIDKHLPWEYNHVALVTLCADCHKAVHAEAIVPIYDCDPEIGKPVSLVKYETCHRCDGKGFIPKYSHVEDGICFNCWGSGYKNFYMQFYTQADIVDFVNKKKKLKYKIEKTDLPF